MKALSNLRAVYYFSTTLCRQPCLKTTSAWVIPVPKTPQIVLSSPSSTSTDDMPSKSKLCCLPPELLLSILSYLSPKELFRLRLASITMMDFVD